MPELLRLDGIVAGAKGVGDPVQGAEASLRQGLALAREQQALGWALRCALSLGQVLLERGGDGEARALASGSSGEVARRRSTSDDLASVRRFMRRADGG